MGRGKGMRRRRMVVVIGLLIVGSLLGGEVGVVACAGYDMGCYFRGT
jgi:hypothetical protein